MISRTLKVPYVSLSRADFERIVNRFEAHGEEADAEKRAQWEERMGPFDSDEDRDEQWASRFNVEPLPRFVIQTKWGNASGKRWAETLNEVDPADIDSIYIRTSSDRVTLEARFQLTGVSALGGANEIRIASDNPDEVRGEVGFFSDLFDRRKSRVRGLLGHWTMFIAGWLASLLAAVYGLFYLVTLLGLGSTPASLVAGIGAAAVVVGVSILYARLTPRVLVEGLGPPRRLAGVTLAIAGALGALVIGVVGGLIVDVITREP